MHGKPLVRHVTDTVTNVFSDCLLVTNTPEQYDFLNIPMIKDRYQDMSEIEQDLDRAGTLVVRSVFLRDYPMVQGVILFLAFFYVFINLLVDISYTFLDPRIRFEKKS